MTDVVVDDGRVDHVEAGDERFDADHVVAALGWRTPDVLDGIVDLPVRPYRTQCVVLDPGVSVTDLAMGWLHEAGVYWRPEHNGDLLVGGYSFAEDDPESASGQADEGFRDQVARLLPDVFHEMDRAEFVNGWAGVDAATPDTHPIIDVADEVENLVVATGVHGRGAMTAPIAATAIQSLVTGEGAPFSLDPFGLDRFDSRSHDFEFHSISGG